MHGWMDGCMMDGWRQPPTCHEADPPQAGVQRHLDLGGLVLLQHDPLLHQQPVVRRHGNADQQEAAGAENRGEQRQRAGAEGTHLGRERRSDGQELMPRKEEKIKREKESG